MKYNYYTMPKSESYVEGMKMIKGDLENFRVEIKPDITYATKNGIDLCLRILKPNPIEKEEDQRLYPLIVHVQGSAWMKQNMNDHLVDFKEIVEAGYMIAIVQYRDSSIVKIPGQVHDVKDAVRFLVTHHQELSIDLNRLYLSGDSSGGHTALLCWVTWPNGKLDKLNEPLPNIRAFMDFYGVVEFSEFVHQISSIDHRGINSPEGMALGGAMEDPLMEEICKKASVLTYIQEDIQNQPLLVLHGNKDRLVPFEQSVLLYKKAKSCNKDITFYCVDGADHGGSAFYCKNVYQIILEFLKQH